MATQIELAQLAAAAYRDSSQENRIPLPTGWQQIAAVPNAAQTSGTTFTGFSASAFRNANDEIVIAYAGTKDTSDWTMANFPIGLGVFSFQVVQAAKFHWDVKQNYGSNIVFAGHSLGGGLASLMAIYFDREATTFDQAPFRLSAIGNSQGADVVKLYGVAFAALGINDPAWLQYLAQVSPVGRQLLYSQREADVSHAYVTNEALYFLRLPGSYIVGQGKEMVLDSG